MVGVTQGPELGIEPGELGGAAYSVRGFTAATDTSYPNALATLWNPSSDKRICVVEVWLFLAGALPQTTRNNPRLVLATARGTAGSTITPDGDNDLGGEGAAPPSGALLDLAAYSAEPTLASPPLWGVTFGGSSVTGSGGHGWTWAAPGGVWVPPGQGLCLLADDGAAAAWPTSEVVFEWLEG